MGTELEINNGNKLIEKFMQSLSGFRYDERWDYLIPVWVKFRDLGLKNTDYEQWVHSLSWYLYSTPVTPFRLFERMVYAITWYNKTLTSQTPSNQ